MWTAGTPASGSTPCSGHLCFQVSRLPAPGRPVTSDLHVGSEQQVRPEAQGNVDLNRACPVLMPPRISGVSPRLAR
ncbi:hypothetical protein PAL_GLEAN10013288 [Pteropus alecto]|uniref:Uncharacterized protein n=1 Tax=Pteropus alecto TaxID=9402 RepID=L5KE90_PTEAL|nr:hypothetical protein PAL_GLEAN10013288 [Pteropus alecto]